MRIKGWHRNPIAPGTFWTYRKRPSDRNATHILNIRNHYIIKYRGRTIRRPDIPRKERYEITLWTQGGWWGRDVKTRKPLKTPQFPLVTKHASTYKEALKKASQMMRTFSKKQRKT